MGACGAFDESRKGERAAGDDELDDSRAALVGRQQDAEVNVVNNEVFKEALVNIETGQVQETEYEYSRAIIPVPDSARYVKKSPDDKWLAFVAAPSSGNGETLYVMPAGGGEARELVRSEKTRVLNIPALLQWNRSSDRLYFGMAAGSREKPQAWTIPLAGGEPQPTGLHLREGVTFAPDGRRVIFGDGKGTQELWVIRNLPGM